MLAYKTISKEADAQLIEKRSRFIAHVSPVRSEKEALDYIENIKAEYWDAKHNVYAYSVRDENRQRYSDDSEPKGTAGLPVLDVIKSEGLNDIVVVVTRYFGGILLGKGGLIRAYSSTAKLGIDKAGVITLSLCKLCKLTADYSFYGKLSALINSNFGLLDDTEFTDKVKLSFHIEESYLDSLVANIRDATAGNFDIEIIGEEFLPRAP